ncbi:sarcosine oxidase subunit delta [Paracoccus sp. MC1862]|uniref:sarcosine oxidase subunit delta n=1 Tax=Paracoccus sp. MC1862 TaxID=2760307 RepID=UPI0015FF4BE3|nr:sarcosine oxidase subunit delta [Paracoccus sp. MC1862]MBB1497399.1 sarcosine oxidase subunit delta [Paracoccus sp. MC1862]QQO45890.1 sarcosine oxidase subunit delta [Paracoccus sp. MC1862]
MLTLTCPFCGVAAEETELAPGGEAHLKRFGPGSSDADFETYLFGRRNPRGVHFERWRHVYGCGKWFLAARDTATLQVFGTYPPQCDGPPDALIARIRAVRPGWQPPPEPLEDDSAPGVERDPAPNPTPTRDTIA